MKEAGAELDAALPTIPCAVIHRQGRGAGTAEIHGNPAKQ